MPGATVHIHCRAVDFEKWQALGNDYLIVEAARLPFEGQTEFFQRLIFSKG